MKTSLTPAALVFACAIHFLVGAPFAAELAAPQIIGFSPVQGTIGTSVSVTGTNLTGTSSVQFNGVEASFTILADIVTAIVPPNATSGPITVKTPGGIAASTEVFTVITSAAPSISSFAPSEGRPGSSVQINGANLVGATSVQFNGVVTSFTTLGDVITAVVPANASTGPITVKTPGGTAVSTATFTVTLLAPPVIDTFTPLDGAAGTAVEIKGTNLTTIASVKFNGVEAAFSVLADILYATVPATALSGPISVTTSAGTAVSSASFTVTQRPAPVVTEFVPLSGQSGASIEIRGSNLENVTSVQFNGANAAFLSLGGTLRATVPASATSGPITVTTPSGSSTSTTSFTVTLGPAPTITSFTPVTGNLGASVEIQGLYLRDIVSVRFNGAEANFATALFRPLTATVPTNATTGPITVVTRNGAVTSTAVFTVLNSVAPIITGLSALSGPPGEVIQIHGTNLTGILAVDFAGTATSFIEFNGERFFAFVPTNAPAGPIKVTTRTGSASSKETFTVVGAPPPSEPPLLSIKALSSGQIELSWKVTAGIQLESTESLAPPVQWSVSPLQAVETQGSSVLVVTTDSNPKFFRLRRP